MTPDPELISASDGGDSNRPPPRVLPPRYAEQQAEALIARVASKPKQRRKRWKPDSRGVAVASGLLAVAGFVEFLDLDLWLNRWPSLALAAIAAVILLKAMVRVRV